jgi:rSAM/selenodomain-associated transferase 1
MSMIDSSGALVSDEDPASPRPTYTTELFYHGRFAAGKGDDAVSTVLVFAKPPIPGRVKTRLVPPLSPAEAARLAGAFLLDLTAALAELPGAHLEIALPAPGAPAAGADWLPAGIPVVSQVEGDLGERLSRATAAAFERRDGPVAAVGADHPSLPARLVSAALAEARGGRVGLVPTDDGGYAALALPRPMPGLFRDVPWSTGEVAAATRRNARALGVALVELGSWYDVDEIADLARLERDLAERPADCPETRAVLASLDPPLSRRTDLEAPRP